jgi:cold shock CspA family protein
MSSEKRPDEIARELAPEPTEPLYTRRTTVGTVKYWRDDKGYGVIASDATAPWDIWCHFSAIERTGGVATLPSGEQFEVTYDEDGRAYSPTGELVVSGYIQHSGFVSLQAGDRVEVSYYRGNQDSFKYVAKRVRRLEPPNTAT